MFIKFLGHLYGMYYKIWYLVNRDRIVEEIGKEIDRQVWKDLDE